MGFMVNGDVTNSDVPGKGKNLKGPLQNGGGSKFNKRRKVSAIRDFPPGCGRRLPSAAAAPEEEEVDLKANGNGNDGFVVPSVQNSKGEKENNVEESGGVEELASSVEKESLVKMESESPDLVPEGTKDLDDLVESITGPEAMGNLESMVGQSSPLVLKKFPPRRRVAAVRDYPPGCGKNAAPLTIKDLGKSAGNEEGMRDDKAVHIVKTIAEDVQDKIQAGDIVNSKVNEKKEIGGVEVKSVHEKESSKNMLRQEQTGKDKDKIQSGDAVNRKMNEKKENRGVGVKSVHEKEPAKTMSRQEQTGKSSIKLPQEKGKSQVDLSSTKKIDRGGERPDTEVKSVHEKEPAKTTSRQEQSGKSTIKLPQEKGKSLVDSSSIKKIDRGGERPGTESVKLNKDMTFKRKLTGSESVGQDRVGDPVIVQSLMTRDNCPWTSGKKTPIPANTTQPRVEQGNKTVKSANRIQTQVEGGMKTFNSASGNPSRVVEDVRGESSDDRVIVLSLMAAKNSVWSHGRRAPKSSSGKAKQRSTKFLS